MDIRDLPLCYTRIPHCLLCGERFARNACFRSIVPTGQYQIPVLTPLMNFEGKDQTVTLQNLNMVFHDDQRLRSNNAPSIHNLCWSALGVRPSINMLYDLGIAMTPLIRGGLPQNIHMQRLALAKAIQVLFSESDEGDSGDSALRGLLGRIGRLPTELITIIWELISPCAVRCLLALRAARNIWPTSAFAAGCASIRLYGDILVYVTRVLDGTYICGIRGGDTLYGYKSSSFSKVPIPSSITAFVFVLGNYGLRRIGFSTKAQPDPAIIKGSRVEDTEFVGIIYPQTPLIVDFEWDALKFSRIFCHNKPGFGHDFLWVTPPPWIQLHSLFVQSFHCWPRHFDFATTSQRYMAYIPLFEDRSHLYGLTAFCSEKGIVGFGTHFHSGSDSPRSSWYGQQNGCAVHIQFGPAETVRSITVFWHQNDRMLKPYLTVTTSKERAYILGPYFPLPETGTKAIFGAGDGDILGLYYDKSPGITGFGFTSVGAAYRPHKTALKPMPHRNIPRTLPEPDMIYHLNTSPFGSFASQAYLKDIKSLQVGYMGSRCKGMLVVYSDDTRNTLGQWHESTRVQPRVQQLHYQRDNMLRFYLTKHNGNMFLNRVESLPAASSSLEANEQFVNFFYGDNIVWLFSEHSDVIFCASD